MMLGPPFERRRATMQINQPLKFLAAGTALALAAVSSVSLAQQQKIQWRMQSAFGSSLTHLGTSGVRFAKDVEEMTDGNFSIRFHEPGALVPALECFDAAAKGSVDACWTTPGYHTGKYPALAFFPTVTVRPTYGDFMAWKILGNGNKLRQ